MKRWRIAQLFLLLLGTNAQRSTESTLDEGAAAAAGGSAKAVERPPSESDSHPIAIMILALGRSGSTLMGQLFRQNEVGGWYRYPTIWRALHDVGTPRYQIKTEIY